MLSSRQYAQKMAVCRARFEKTLVINFCYCIESDLKTDVSLELATEVVTEVGFEVAFEVATVFAIR